MGLTSPRPLATGLVCAALSTASPAPLLAWWNDAWGVRVKITLDNSAQAENLVNFPVLVRLDSSRVKYFRTQDAGQDMRFVDADDTTVLAHEIETWNEAGSSYVWVRVPQVDASSSTDYIWMYYGNVNAADGQNATAVWNANYRGVWHLRENPGGTSPQMRDSTSYGSHGTTSGGMTAAQQVPGRIGGALNFDGTDDYVSGSIPAAPTQYTYEAWINRSTAANPEDHILALSNTQFFVEDNDKLEAGTTSEFNVNGPTSIVPGTWYHAAFVQGAAGWTIYLNGQVEASGANTTAPGTNFFIGVYPVPASGGYFPGLIDEARISDTPRSAAWMAAQYMSMSDTFATYGAPEGGLCCQSLTTTMAGSDITVTSPASFEMVFRLNAGGALDSFWDLAEDPTRLYDLAGKPAPSEFRGLFHASFDEAVTGNLYVTGQNSKGPKLDLLEATSARVRVRSEMFLQQRPSAGTGVLAGVKGVADYSIYPSAKLGLRWNRRVTANVGYTKHPLEIGVHYQASPDPRSSATGFSQYTAFPVPPTATTPAAATDDFVLARYDAAGARTDSLAVMYQDWAQADELTYANNVSFFSWRDSPSPATVTLTPAANASQFWNFLIHYKPTNFVSNVDPAVTSRSRDFRGPSALTTLVGGPWQSTSENTGGGDDFNEAEAAYPLTLDPALGLRFRIDGSVATPRYSPFFKIRQWRSQAGPPSVTLNGTTLTADVDYKAAVKPVARGHYADSLIWHSTLEDAAALGASLDVGGSGAVSGTTTFTPARYGNGVRIDENGDYVSADSVSFDVVSGGVEFWYQPAYNHDDGLRHILWFNDGGGSDYFLLEKAATTNELLLTANNGGGSGSVSVSSANYSWRAGDWVHIRTTWTPLTILINGSMPTQTVTGAYDGGGMGQGMTYFGGCGGACPGTDANANGIIDEPHIYGDAISPRFLGYGGLTSNANEYLAQAGRDFTFTFQPTDASRRGPYLMVGADSQFRGLNVSLLTAGVGASVDLQWEYWNGTAWANLESVGGFTDETNHFRKNGSVYWSDPPSWTPYSQRGGLDLYYVRAHLPATSGSYTTFPRESRITTDILLFQYCGDISAPAQEFLFAAPVPTAVRLTSFSATPGDGSVMLEWQTGSELDNLGFHLYRGPSADGPWTRLTSSLIPGLGSSPLGQAYSWLDSGLVNGTTYYYRLEDVDTSSTSRFHGPVSAVPGAEAVAAPPAGGGNGEGGDGAGGEPDVSSCPSWVLAAAPDAITPTCTRHGSPESVSLDVLSRDASGATLELRTGGFWALHDPGGTVRVFVPGLEFPTEPRAPTLPLRRTLVEAVVGRGVRLVSAQASDLQTFGDLRPSAVGTPELAVHRDGTVRPARHALAPPLLTRGYRPREVARLVGTAFQGERKSAVVEITPVRLSGSGLVLAGRVRVRLAFTGVVEGESGTGSRGRSLPRERGFFRFRDVLAELHTSRRGLHAVRFEELFPLGPRALPTAFLRLQREGEAVTFHVEPQRAVFGPGSTLFFYTDRTASTTDYSPEVAYELVRCSGLQMGTLSTPPLGAPVASSSTGLASFETNRIYQPGLLEAEDLWLWDAMVSGASRTEGFALSGVATASAEPAKLVVYLQGGSESGQAVDHHVELSVNGASVGETSFAGRRSHQVELLLPASLLREGANELLVANRGDTGVYSLVFLDRFAISYPQSSRARQGVFEGVWAEGGTVEVTGFSGPAVVLRNSGPAVQWLTGSQQTPGSVRFQAEAGDRYLVVSPEGLQAPRVARVVPSALKGRSNQADYIVIAPRELLEAAQPLVERRRRQGLSSRAVAFEEIASEFGHGQPSAESIRRFLSYAWHSWQPPSPRYVLLLGDATCDPQRFVATSPPSPLPALWARTSYLWTVSDPALAAVNGEDALPDLAIGRLPATSREEAERFISKLLAWEDSGQGLSGHAVLVADNPDLGGDFEADVEDIRASFLSGRATTTLKVGELGSATRPAIISSFDEGTSLMSYVGHGGVAVWASENVLNSWDVPALRAQSRQPVLLAWNCLNGYFVATGLDALPEALLKADGRGVVAAFAPSGLSLDGPANQYHRAVMAELASGMHDRLGDAILAAQRTYAQTGLMPELLTVYQLLGDPAMRIR